jgi:hypothetical protein
VAFPSLHHPKSEPRAAGVHLSHFPHPVSPPVTGIGRRRHRPCAMATAPLFPIWAGQFLPTGTVGVFILLWINLNNSNEIQTSEISRKLNKFHKNMKPLLMFKFNYILQNKNIK